MSPHLGSWAQALRRLQRGALWQGEAAPTSPEALRELLAAHRDSAWVVVGRGTQGGSRPQQPFRALHTGALVAGSPETDSDAMILRIDARASWQEAEAAAQRAGWTVAYLSDAWSESSVGGSLSIRAGLPATWLACHAHAAVADVEAIGWDGHLYRNARAPRTASGPDLRYTFLGKEGQSGVLLRVGIEARPAWGWSAWRLAGGLCAWPQVRALAEVAPHRFARLSWRDGHWEGWVWGDDRLGVVLRERLARLGAETERDTPTPLPALHAGRRLQVLRPWSDLGSLSDELAASVEVVGTSPTHVAMRWSVASDAEARRIASLCLQGDARGLVAWRPAGWCSTLTAPGATS